MTISAEGPLTQTATRANLELATDLLTKCFDPPRPDEFARFCADDRARYVFAAFAAAFPDARFHATWIVADDRRVAIGGRLEATHRGDWRGVPATGRSVDVMTIVSFTVVESAVVDVTVLSDSLAMAEQVGAVAPLGARACEVFDQGAGAS